nr:MoxR family ATPase [Salsuginibacillus kocurii]
MTSLQNIKENVERVVVGKSQEIELSLTALLAGGHVLLEDVPGVGKTMMVRAIAQSVGADFKRIQFTPDLLPSDVTGVSVFNQQSLQFEYRPGPVMSHVLLADEINRTSPKTQSALLEALEEGSVTVDGKTRDLKNPFFVMATQNPIEYGGTYPLPEAQLDRFLLKIDVGYPSHEEEFEMLSRLETGHPIDRLESVISLEEIVAMKEEVARVYVDEAVKQYMIDLVQSTRNDSEIELGASPRGTIALMKVSQAYAFIQGRDYVLPDDVKQLAPYALGHRVILRSDLHMAERQGADVIRDVMGRIQVPATRKEAKKWS